MSKILDFWKRNKYAIMWTMAYIAIIWAVLVFLFGFNIFILHNWALLTHAKIHGFAGFVFCLLILAAIPMYIATTTIIMRTRKPLVNININNVFKVCTCWVPHIPESKTVTTEQTPEQITQQPEKPSEPEFPPEMPTEVRNAFMATRHHISSRQISAYNRQTPTPEQQSTPTTEPDTKQPTEISDIGDIPLPTDFDFDDTPATDTNIMNTPIFTDISFSDNTDDDTDYVSDDSETPNVSTSVIEYLNSHNRPATPIGDMVISDNIIIATHDSPEFWIADPEMWFAAGTQKPSPIIALIKESATHHCTPVLYLAQTNIMDIDNRRTEWTKMGITVITDLAELPTTK